MAGMKRPNDHAERQKSNPKNNKKKNMVPDLIICQTTLYNHPTSMQPVTLNCTAMNVRYIFKYTHRVMLCKTYTLTR